MAVAKRVLVVEDNELNLKLFGDVLRGNGFDVEPLNDGRVAVDRARAFSPHVVVMDMRLGVADGIDLIGEMKRDAALRAIPILAVTAYASHDEEERVRAAGASAYVTKPVSMARFVAEVSALA